AIGSLWHHLDDAWIDAIAATKQAVESDSTSYRACIALFRDALAIAAAKAIGQLPEHEDVEIDATVKQERLLDELVAWLLKERTFRADNGNAVSTSVFGWLNLLPPGDVWQQCFTAPGFGTLADGRRTIAVNGSSMAAELKRT